MFTVLAPLGARDWNFLFLKPPPGPDPAAHFLLTYFLLQGGRRGSRPDTPPPCNKKYADKKLGARSGPGGGLRNKKFQPPGSQGAPEAPKRSKTYTVGWLVGWLVGQLSAVS